jgi:hypothetical protein
VSLGPTLIVTKLREPGIAPRLGTLEFPENCPAKGAIGVVDVMQDVAAVLAHGHRLNGVEREMTAQKVFKLEFQDLALSLRRALFGPTLQVRDLPAQVRDEPLLVRFSQSILLGCFSFGIFANFYPFFIELPIDGQFKCLFFVLQFAAFSAKVQLGLAPSSKICNQCWPRACLGRRTDPSHTLDSPFH